MANLSVKDPLDLLETLALRDCLDNQGSVEVKVEQEREEDQEILEQLGQLVHKEPG